MDAYRQGLTGKAADWAVRKQKSHRKIGQHAMMSIEAVLNTNWPHQGHKKNIFLDQKIILTEISWEKPAEVSFGHFQPPWEWIWHPFVPQKSRSGTSKFVNFGCPALYTNTYQMTIVLADSKVINCLFIVLKSILKIELYSSRTWSHCKHISYQKEKNKLIFKTGNPVLYCGYLAIKHILLKN